MEIVNMNNCASCLKEVTSENNDIRLLTICEKPALEAFEELFDIKIKPAERQQKNLPYKICDNCIRDMESMMVLKSLALGSHNRIELRRSRAERLGPQHL